MKKITWRKIREPNLHGEEGTCGPRRAELVRAYNSEWHVFLFEGKKCVGINGKYPYQEAKHLAAKWLRE